MSLSSVGIIKKGIGTLVFLALAAMVVAWAAWYLTGGRLYVITTPSMSPTEPVGSLVVVSPTHSVRIGDIAIFEPVGTNTVFAHEVVAQLPNGDLRTKGLLNSSLDPWTLSPDQIQGKAVAIYPALGRVMQALPIWVVCFLLYIALGWGLPRWKGLIGAAMFALALILPLIIYHPLVNAQIVTAIVKHHDLHVYAVSTGILDAWIHLGRNYFVMAGHTVVMSTRHYQRTVALPIIAALSWWEWLIAAAIWAIPALVAWHHAETMEMVDSQMVSV
jgi:hypothetical protein